MPIVHSVGISVGMSQAVAVGTVVVRQPDELRDALAQRDKPIVIDNPKLERKFERIEFWQGREGTFRFIGALLVAILALALALEYRIDASWKYDWKLERLDGKLSLTPTKRAN